MTSENWSDFSDLITTKLNQHQTPLSLQTSESIDTIWHKIEHSIISAATSIISNKISHKRSYNYKYTPHSTQLYLSLKKLGHLIKNLKSTNTTLDISSVNLQIQDINSRSQCNLQTLSSSDPAQILEWLNHAKDIWYQLYQARHTENSFLLRQQIQQASEKRCETLVSKPTQAINSILNRYQAPIHFSNIKLPDQLITEPTLIKQHIQQHFYNWTAYKPINQALFDSSWQQQYLPQAHINSD
jgi:hypothetical protein